MKYKKEPNITKNKIIITGICASVIISSSTYNASANSAYGSLLYAPAAHSELHQMQQEPSEPPASQANSDISAITIESDTDDSGSKGDGKRSLRYKLLAARLELETGHIYRASKQLNSLLAQPENKNNSELLGFTANAENYGGNWPYATELLNSAHAIAPDNQDVSELLHDIRRDNAQNAEIGYDWIKYGSTYENIGKIDGFVNAGNHLIIGGSAKYNNITGKTVRLANGTIGDSNGNKGQGELYAQYSIQNGQRFKISAFGNNDTAGTGGYYSFLNPLGESILSAEYHKPYWEIPEAVLGDATRDRVSVDHIIKPSNKLTLEADLGLNRYNISQVKNVADSYNWDLNVIYRVIDEVKYHKPFFDIGYNIDAEYMTRHKDNLDSTGNMSHIFPLISRQIHTPFIEVGYDYDPFTYGNIMAGYEYDMLNSNHGPTIGGKITHEFNRALDMRVHASYGVNSYSSANNMAIVGSDLRWRF